MQRLPLPEGVPTGVEVWQLALNLQMPVSEADASLLSEDELIRAQRFRQHADRVRSIATRAALRRVLALRTRLRPNALCFAENRYGKPYLEKVDGLEFNVSHAGCFALIALSTNGQVGVDIEYRNRGIDARDLGAYVFSQLEHASGLKTNEAFIERWVAKESVLKALGVGISEHLQAISILPDDAGGYRVSHNHPEWLGIKVWSIEAPDCYAAALAVKNRDSALSALKTFPS